MLSLSVLCSAPPPTTLPKFILTEDQQWAAITATAKLTSTQGIKSTASGVCVAIRDNKAYLLTADHFVRGSAGIEAEFYTKLSLPIRAKVLKPLTVVAQFREADFAVLSAPLGDLEIPVLKIAGPGERPKAYPFLAASVGCEWGHPTVQQETVLGKRLVRQRAELAFYWEFGRIPEKGRSGGPILDGRGRLIGLQSATQDNRGYATHLDEILAGLKREKLAWLWDNANEK
jgi:S1-C subfamily serine protease